MGKVVMNNGYSFGARNMGLLIFGAGVIFQLTYIRYGINMLDGGLLLASSKRALGGEVSMVDFFGYPPGKSSYIALFFKLFGESIFVSRVAMILVSASTMVLLFYLCRFIMPFPYAIVPSILLLGAPGGYHCRFISFFTLLNLLIILHFIRKPGGPALFAASFTGAVTIFFRLDISLFSLFTLLAVLVFQNIKRVRRGEPFTVMARKILKGAPHYTLGLSAPFTVILVYMYANSAFQQEVMTHIRSMSNFNREVVIVTPPDILQIFKPDTAHKKRVLFEGVIFYYPFILYCAAFLWSLRKVMTGKADLSLIAILVFGAETLSYPLSFPDFWHAITIYPLVFVITAYLFSRLAARGEPLIKKRSKVLVKSLLPLLVSVFLIVTSLNYGVVLGSVGEIRREHVFLDLPGIQIYVPSEKYETIKNVITFITSNSTKEDGLFVVPHEAVWYFFCDRKNPTRFDYLMPGHMDERVQLKIVDDLRQDTPKFIIYQNSSLMGKEETKLGNFAKHIDVFIRTRYSLVSTFGEYQILSLNSVPERRSGRYRSANGSSG